MPADKFGRNEDRATPVYTGINITNLTNTFLRRDRGNIAIEAIDMNNSTIKNVSDPLTNQDVATKNYVDTNAFPKTGGVVSGDIKLNVGSDLEWSLGCDNLSAGKKFALLLGSDRNMLSYSVPNSGLPAPVTIKADVAFAILIKELPVCVFGKDEILCSQPIDMDRHSIKNVKNPIDILDAVNKAYAYRIKYKTASGNIPNTVLTDHILFIFPTGKAFASGKIKICEMWVERLVDKWVATSSSMFATEWPSFHKFSRGPSLTTFFTGSLASGGHGIFALTILNYRKSAL